MKYFSLLSTCLFLLMGCQQEEDKYTLLPPVTLDKSAVTIQFHFSPQPNTRNLDNSDIVSEENNVNNLVYAIFQQNLCRKIEKIHLNQEAIQTGINGKYYTIPSIPKKWLDRTTEIYAVANAPKALIDSLLKGQYQIPADEPLLQRLVAEQIDSLSRVDIYNSIIDRQYRGYTLPTDQKIHFFPINGSNYRYPATFELPAKYRFQNYSEFRKNLENPTFPAAVKQTYEQIWIDLQCRIAIYRGNDFNNKKNQLTTQEKNNHAIRTSFQKNRALQKYLLWRNQEWKADLNEEVRQKPSRWIEEPIMAGCYMLNENFPPTIVVPVERIYNRIWFNFQWDAHKETEQIVIDSITVSGLTQNTKLFNLAQEPTGNHPTELIRMNITLCNAQTDTNESILQPFFPSPTANGYPYHIGEKPRMLLSNQIHQDIKIPLWVYQQTPTGETDSSKAPHRCYVYSFQLGGHSEKDDPEIVVYYHFQRTTAKDQSNVLVYKKARARLYDETHYPGKRHHGLLRNYTYQLNCKVTSLNHTLEIQVMAVPWYKITIEDIPPFE